MKARLYKRLRDTITEYVNTNISKSDFLNIVRSDLMEYYPNRVIKMVDTSTARRTSVNPHVPILFIELDPTNDGSKVSYTFLLNIDRMGSTDVLTPDLFIASLIFQIENIDTHTKDLLTVLDAKDYGTVNPDIETIWVQYLKIYSCMLKHLREQNAEPYSFALLNGVITTDADIDALINRIHFDQLLDFETEFTDVMEAKYHLPADLKTLVDRVYNNYKRLIK